ncbi:MAG: TonB-dependent receptor plug domain-containing protein [Bacteroidales bacterium]|nr:TonB-dependent receptor plug domain-containing protein [Bacteroidales bacterium]
MGRAVDDFVASDTLRQLEEVRVLGHKSPGPSANKMYSAGSGFIRFNAEQLSSVQHLDLGSYLGKRTALLIKERGRGMLSSVSIRGTAAAHTAVKWNGLDLSMPTMGQTDFSHLPLSFFDEVSVHLGGESALYGNGAMGGSIMLTTSPKFEQGVHGSLHQCIGSYGYTFSGLLLRIAGKDWESRTNVFYTQAANDYTFTNNTTYDFRRDTLKNAAFKNWGVLQELYYKPEDYFQLTARVWYMDFYREIQPPVSMNEDQRRYENITDRNFRALLNYQGEQGAFKINAQMGYAYDYELFQTDIIAADKLPLLLEMEFKQTQWSLKAGINSEYIKPKVYAYAVGTDEWRTEVYLFALWKPLERWVFTAGLRQLRVSDVAVPITPSLGVSCVLWNNTEHTLKWRAAFSRNIKIPTLNDRYWGGLKNTYLKPEIGLSGETGFNYNYAFSDINLKADFTAYYSRIADWIHWTPRGNRSYPENMNLVDAYGIECLLQLTKQWEEWKLEGTANYAYTPVIKREGTHEWDTGVGKQVPHQPQHVVNAMLEAGYRKFIGQAGFHLVGSRHSSDIFDVMRPYALLDISVGYVFSIKNVSLLFLLQANNVTGTDYQNMKNYAMPGRNYAITLRYSF